MGGNGVPTCISNVGTYLVIWEMRWCDTIYLNFTDLGSKERWGWWREEDKGSGVFEAK